MHIFHVQYLETRYTVKQWTTYAKDMVSAIEAFAQHQAEQGTAFEVVGCIYG